MPDTSEHRALDPQFTPPPNRARVLLAAFALLCALTALMTYPQVLQMGRGVADVGDPLLNTWALSWVAHQAVTAPARIFDGNIFYPERWTLAYSEPMLVPGLTAAPLSWAGVGPILVYNLVFWSGIVLSGLGVTLLVLDLTGQASAAVIAGMIFAFLPFRMDHYSHLQLQQTQWIPLTMWALHKVVRSGRLVDGAKLGTFAAFQMLSCVYFGVFLAPYVAVAALVLLAAEARLATSGPDVVVRYDRRFARRSGVAFAAAAVVYVVLVAPVGRAHLAASRVVGERSPVEAVAGSATPANYLATSASNRLYGRWADRFGHPERRLFPGAVAVLLALIGLRRPWSAPQVAYGVALLFAFDLSLGFNGFSYGILRNVALPFRGLRVPARMGLFVGFSLAVLAGYGVARLNATIHSASRRRWLAVALSVLILIEYQSKPFGLTMMADSPPPVYADLLQERGNAPPVALVELPLHASPTYMYYSTFHWQNLLNGYSGFFPPSFHALALALESFPDARSIDALRRQGARFVVIHGELLARREYDALVESADRVADLKLIARRPWQGHEVSLYRLMVDVQ